MSDLHYFSAAALTVVLVVAGTAKLRAPERFRAALESYRLIPAGLITPLVYGVPALELSSALLQWVPSFQPAVTIAITAMFVLFTLLLLASLLSHDDADCGCFGTAAPEKVSWFSIVRNVALMAISLAPAIASDAPGDARIPAVLAGTGAGALILLLDQALTMLSRPRGPASARRPRRVDAPRPRDL